MHHHGLGRRSMHHVGRTLMAMVALTSLVAASLVTLVAWAPAAHAEGVPTISSDLPDYVPGATVSLTGTDWQPAELVRIVVNDTIGQTWQRDVTVVADVDGAISDSFMLPTYFVSNYDVTATGETSGVATTAFTDLPIGTYDQCSNDLGTGYSSGDSGCRWINGNLQSNNSTYAEDDATVQRLWLTDLLPGTTHTLTLTYDTTKSGKHAYDFLTTWNWSENWITAADRCQDITGCVLDATESTVDIPEDPNVPNTFEPSAPGDRQFVMRGGSLVSAATPVIVSGTYAGNSTTSISVTFDVGPGTGAMCETKHSVTTCGVALWFGAHVAAQSDWGIGLGAGSIEGSPYHVALDELDGAAIGGRDNQMQTATVYGTGSLTLSKILSGGPAGYTGPFTVHYDCGGTLTDDVSLAAGGSITISGIPTDTVCTVTEPTLPVPPSGHSFGTPSFTDSSGTANDGVVTIEGGVAVGVTTNNTLTRDTGTLTISKTLSNPDSAPVPATFTVNYDCGIGYTGSRSVAPNGTATVTGIPTGNTCTITEAALAPIAGYTWATPTYSPASIVISDTTSTFTLTVANAIARDQGTLTIKKTLSNPNGATVPATFTVNYNCGSGYTGSTSVAPNGTATVTGIPTGNTCTITEAALAPIPGYFWLAPTYSPASIVIGNTSGTFTLTVTNVIKRDNTPPACALTATIPGPPTVIKVTTSDASSGLKSIVVTKSVNATVNVPAFAQGSTASVVVTATKLNQSLASQVALRVTDIAGNFTDCDPVILTAVGPVTSETVTNVPTAERVLSVINGTPGLRVVTANVNGKQFVIANLRSGERRSIDIGSALRPGDNNTVRLFGAGPVGSSATLMIWDGIGTL